MGSKLFLTTLLILFAAFKSSAQVDTTGVAIDISIPSNLSSDDSLLYINDGLVDAQVEFALNQQNDSLTFWIEFDAIDQDNNSILLYSRSYSYSELVVQFANEALTVSVPLGTTVNFPVYNFYLRVEDAEGNQVMFYSKKYYNAL